MSPSLQDLISDLKEKNGTKIVMLVADGLGGLPITPGGKTELETASTPNLDQLATEGTIHFSSRSVEAFWKPLGLTWKWATAMSPSVGISAPSTPTESLQIAVQAGFPAKSAPGWPRSYTTMSGSPVWKF